MTMQVNKLRRMLHCFSAALLVGTACSSPQGVTTQSSGSPHVEPAATEQKPVPPERNRASDGDSNQANTTLQASWANHLEAANEHYKFTPEQAKKATAAYDSCVARAAAARNAFEEACKQADLTKDSKAASAAATKLQHTLQALSHECIDRIDSVASIEQIESARVNGFKSPRYAKVPPSPEAGKTAANFALKTPEGETVSLKSLEGKIVLLKFWGSWCGFCRRSLPDFQNLHEKYKDNPAVAVVGISCEKGRGSASPLKLIKDEGYTFEVLLDGDPAAAAYMVRGYPTVYIIGPDGKIIHMERGAKPNAVELYSSLVDAALKELKAPTHAAETTTR